MSSISGFGDSFDPSSDNNGQIVSSDMYEGGVPSGHDIGNSIMSQIGGGKQFGFNLSDVVSAMVEGDMMDEIPDLQRQITNTNVRISAVAKIENLMTQLQSTTLVPTEAGVSPYTLQSSDPTDIVIENTTNGSNTPYIQPFQVNVTSIATTDSWSFNTIQTSPTTAISGGGQLSITMDSGKSTQVTIQNNSSLNDIANQINAADASVTASVVPKTDGYALAIVSNSTGEDHKITFAYTSSTAGDLDSFMNSANRTNSQPAVDASYSINGINMNSDTNDISFSGVSLYLNKNNSSATISTVTNTSAVSQSVGQFVQNYNELITQINQITSLTPGQQYRGSLYQDKDMTTVRENLRNTMLTTLSNGMSLANLGIDYNSDGTLSLNQSALFTSLDENPSVATQILATHLSATNSYVQAVNFNKVGDVALAQTQSGTYALNVTQVASTSAMQATSAMTVSGGNITIGSDVTMDISVSGLPNPAKFDGNTQTISNIIVTIPASGSPYTTTALAETIQEQINNASGVTTNNAGVSVTIDASGYLHIESQNTGSQTGFTINSAGSTNLNQLGISGGNVDVAHDGLDVEGTINGQICFGSGQYLEAQDDPTAGTDASGFIVKYTGSTTGSMGTVTLSKGYSEMLDSLVTGLTNYVQTNPDSSGLLALKDYNYQQDLDPNNLRSLTNQLKDAKAKKDQLTQMYLSRYRDVNGILATLGGESRYISAMFQNNDNENN